MGSPHYLKNALYEHRFWLQVLGDHSRFIFNTLAPKEVAEIRKANEFIQTFDHLLHLARQPIGDTKIVSLNQQALFYSQQIRAFKLFLIRKHLQGEITIHLPPTFLNHMVNEVEEYLRLLGYIITGQTPPAVNPIHHHLLWLTDAAGHAGTITDNLDAVEKMLKEKGMSFAKHFEQLYIKAIEVAGYMRSGLNQFPALARLNQEAALEIMVFKQFLHEIEEMKLSAQTLGILSPLMADHMAREECYYLNKLAESSDVKDPECDPTMPRTEK